MNARLFYIIHCPAKIIENEERSNIYYNIISYIYITHKDAQISYEQVISQRLSFKLKVENGSRHFHRR